MLLRDQTNPKIKIEHAVLKAFAIAGQKQYPKPLDILSSLDVSTICPAPYRSILYSKTSLIKSLLFMELLDKSHSDFVKYLEKKVYRKKKLGLGLSRKPLPDQTTISKFKKKMVNDEVKERLRFTVQKIRENAIKNKISLDVDAKPTDLNKGKTSKEKDEISVSWILRGVSKKIKRRILSFIPISSAPNEKYSKKLILQVFLYMCQGNDFANGAIDDLREEKKENRMFCPRCYHLLFPLSDWLNQVRYENIMICPGCGFEKPLVPDPDTVFYRLKKVGRTESKDANNENEQSELQKIQRRFSVAKEVIYGMVNETDQLQQPVNIKIGFKDDFVDMSFDYTEWFFYGNINAEKLRGHICGKKPERGTSYCFKFIAADVIASRRRLTIDVLPFRETKKMEILRQLLTYVKEKVKIGTVVIDKGFWDHKILEMLEEFHVYYLMLCPRQSKKMKGKNNENKIDETDSRAPVPFYYANQKLGNASFNKIVAKKTIRNREVTLAFATNRKFTNITDAEKFTDLYPLRWGIETGFRVKKKAFLPRTTSPNMNVRLIFFLFTVLLYNIWYLADIQVWLDRHKTVGEKRIVTANHFRTIFKIIMEDPG